MTVRNHDRPAVQVADTARTIPDDADVVIVGAGPVGLTLALLLGARGRTVVILERWQAAYPLPRAVGISHDSVRILQSAGVLPDLADILVFEKRDLVGQFVDARGEILFSNNRYPGLAASGFPTMTGFNQPDLEAALEACCIRHPHIHIARGWNVTGAVQSNAHVDVALSRTREGAAPDSDAALSVRARFLVGCDGANSIVRSLMASEMIDSGFSSSWLVVDILPTTARDWRPELGQVLDPGRPTTLVPAGPGRRRFEMMALPGETAEHLTDIPTVWRLLGKFGVDPGNAELVRRAYYTFRGRWADRWRDGHMMIAGDAAHQMPPFLGQGLNSGMRDAAALAWRLAMVLVGDAPPALLDSYTRERLPHVRQIIDQAVGVGRMICVTDPVAAAERDAVLRGWTARPSTVPSPPEWRLGPGILMPDDPHAGLLGVQGRVQAKGPPILFDDLFGGGRFALIGDGIDPLGAVSDAVKSRWSQLDGVAVGIGREVSDPDATYRRWFDRLGAAVALVRPDFAIYGTAADPAGVDALVNTLVGQLGMASSAAPSIVAPLHHAAEP